jgi:hypothetical protein
MPSNTGQQMNDLLRPQRPQPSPSAEKIDGIRGLYGQGLQQLRGARNMHPDARRVEIARLYATTRQALAKVRADQQDTDNKTYAKLERQMFGYDDVRALATDKASVDATIRDAQDRAAQLTKPEQAARALENAELAGDHVLARAIFKRAHDYDWNAVIDAYLSTRPTASEAYQQAGTIWHRYNNPNASMQDAMQYTLGKPEELRGLADKDIEAMADPGESAA